MVQQLIYSRKTTSVEGVEAVTQSIIKKWLTSGAPTRSYQHLIECLRQSELGALAEEIATNTTGMSMVHLWSECMLTC